MKINTFSHRPRTHEGGSARIISSAQKLRRSVMGCMLWEKTFYEDGVDIAERIATLVPKVSPRVVADMAIEAREKMKLRHVPLLIVREMARYPEHKKYVAELLSRIIQRPDELTEFVTIYWKDGKEPLSAQVKKGLAGAFTKFDAYQLAKYNRKGLVRLRDVLFLCHAKPKNEEQVETWRKLVDDELPPPDTWEVALSSGADKKETWERLLRENRLGALALLRNLRNMANVGVEERLIFEALERMNVTKILPFRFIAAAKHAPQWESHIEEAMLKCLAAQEKLTGKTVILVDVSGSMSWEISYGSDLSRLDSANGLAILIREISESVAIYSFSNDVVRVSDRRGFSLSDAIVNSQYNGGTYLGGAVEEVNKKEDYDRIIVITDEQSCDPVPAPRKGARGYIINVATYENGIGYGEWIHIDGWSEAVIDYIKEYEKEIDIDI